MVIIAVCSVTAVVLMSEVFETKNKMETVVHIKVWFDVKT
jgi:hypothetical protein